jgi:hypothetical protein
MTLLRAHEPSFTLNGGSAALHRGLAQRRSRCPYSGRQNEALQARSLASLLMAAVLGSAAVGMGAGVMAERNGYIAQALAALSEVLPAGVAAVEGAAAVAGKAAAAPLAVAATPLVSAAQATSGTGSRKTVVVVALLALGAGAVTHRVGVKGVKRAWRQARAACTRRRASDACRALTDIPHCAGCGRRHRSGRSPDGRLSRRHQEPAACRGQRQVRGCAVRDLPAAPPNRNWPLIPPCALRAELRTAVVAEASKALELAAASPAAKAARRELGAAVSAAGQGVEAAKAAIAPAAARAKAELSAAADSIAVRSRRSLLFAQAAAAETLASPPPALAAVAEALQALTPVSRARFQALEARVAALAGESPAASPAASPAVSPAPTPTPARLAADGETEQGPPKRRDVSPPPYPAPASPTRPGEAASPPPAKKSGKKAVPKPQ